MAFRKPLQIRRPFLRGGSGLPQALQLLADARDRSKERKEREEDDTGTLFVLEETAAFGTWHQEQANAEALKEERTPTAVQFDAVKARVESIRRRGEAAGIGQEHIERAVLAAYQRTDGYFAQRREEDRQATAQQIAQVAAAGQDAFVQQTASVGIGIAGARTPAEAVKGLRVWERGYAERPDVMVPRDADGSPSAAADADALRGLLRPSLARFAAEGRIGHVWQQYQKGEHFLLNDPLFTVLDPTGEVRGKLFTEVNTRNNAAVAAREQQLEAAERGEGDRRKRLRNDSLRRISAGEALSGVKADWLKATGGDYEGWLAIAAAGDKLSGHEADLLDARTKDDPIALAFMRDAVRAIHTPGGGRERLEAISNAAYEALLAEKIGPTQLAQVQDLVEARIEGGIEDAGLHDVEAGIQEDFTGRFIEVRIPGEEPTYPTVLGGYVSGGVALKHLTGAKRERVLSLVDRLEYELREEGERYGGRLPPDHGAYLAARYTVEMAMLYELLTSPADKDLVNRPDYEDAYRGLRPVEGAGAPLLTDKEVFDSMGGMTPRLQRAARFTEAGELVEVDSIRQVKALVSMGVLTDDEHALALEELRRTVEYLSHRARRTGPSLRDRARAAGSGRRP